MTTLVYRMTTLVYGMTTFVYGMTTLVYGMHIFSSFFSSLFFNILHLSKREGGVGGGGGFWLLVITAPWASRRWGGCHCVFLMNLHIVIFTVCCSRK